MASKFSVWLRETARLYLRYVSVGLVCLPFAAGYAWAVQSWGHPRILVPVLAACGFSAALWTWRTMGDWQIKPKTPVDAFEARWAELLRSASLEYRLPDEKAVLTWNAVLIEASLNRAPVQMASQSTEALQQMLTGRPTMSLNLPQNAPASTFVFGEQMAAPAQA